MDRAVYLDRFRIVTDRLGAPVELRRVGSTVTYKAQDTVSGGEVALEVMSAFELHPAVLEELEGEAAVASQLKHLNIPILHAFGTEAGRLVYASEYCDGPSAEAWVKSHGPMPVSPVLRIALQIGSALEAASFQGIVHPAINPRNIILVPGQTPEGDWPLIKILGMVGPPPSFAESDAAANFAGKFASPEQQQTGAVDFRSEMYSLGATLWYLLTGAAPDLDEPRGKVSGLPKPVLLLLNQMLAPNPDDRPHDPLAVQENIRIRLEQVTERHEAAVPEISRHAELDDDLVEMVPRRGNLWKALAIAAVLFVLATLAFVFGPNLLRRGGRAGDVAKSEPIGVPVGVPEPVAATASPPIAESPPPAEPVESNPMTPAPRVAANVLRHTAPSPSPAARVTPREEIPASRARIVSLPPEPAVPEPTEAPTPEATATPDFAAQEPTPASAPQTTMIRVPDEDEEDDDPEAESAPVATAEETPAAPALEVRPALPVTDEDLARATASTPIPAARSRRINGLEVRPAEPVDDEALASGPPR